MSRRINTRSRRARLVQKPSSSSVRRPRRVAAHRMALPRVSDTAARSFIVFELDPDSRRAIETLAREAGCDPFEMCVQLLREGLARR